MRITAQNLINIKPQLADFLSSLEVGDTVKGRIMEILGESISIKTASGQIFMAALMTDAELKQGQSIELVINDINEEGIFAELKQGAQKTAKVTEDAKLQQVLKQLDIKPEEGNMQSAKLLLKYNMPITKENIVKLAATQKSIETMAQGDAVKALSLMQSEQELTNTEFTKLAKQTVLLEEQGKLAFKLLVQDSSEAPAAVNKNAELTKTEAEVSKSIRQEPRAEVKPQSEPVTKQVDMQPVLKEGIKQHEAEATVKQILMQLTGLLDSDSVQSQENIPKLQKLIDTIVKLFETASAVKPEHSAYLISKDIEVTPSTVKSLIQNPKSEDKLGAQLERLDKLAEVLEQKGVDVKEVKEELKKSFLKPEALQDKEQVQESMKDAVKAAGKLEALIKEHGLEDRLDKSVLPDLKGNIDFLKNINTNMSYIQIPLLINQSKTTADLYVFSGRKRSKNINPENASILIALDLKALGHIESLISVNKKSVKVTIKVERDELKKLIKDSSENLKQSLQARGYTMYAIQVIDMTERFNLPELEELNAIAPGNMHLDIKV
ncbi:MAG: Flagellar hook-length control protein FliK [Clostridia bacterium]|jgi:hypothetical protein|nr:Flagellar hook-length control protein FliK [Clostridia bacterium]